MVFFSNTIISKIKFHSNCKLRQFLACNKDVSGRYFNEFTFEEMQAFMGLIILTGVFRKKIGNLFPNFILKIQISLA